MTRRAEKLVAVLCGLFACHVVAAAFLSALLFAWALLGPRHHRSAREAEPGIAPTDVAVLQP